MVAKVGLEPTEFSF